MKLWIVSDLHVGRGTTWAPDIPEHDVMIIAGDVAADHMDTLLALFAMARWSPAPIVFVPGNHDLFGAQIDDWDGENRRLDDAGVHVLPSGQSVVIDGVRFVGATLWTDFEIAGDVHGSEAWAARHMPEYQRVTGPDGDLLWPEHTAEAHARHRAAVDRTLAQPHAGPTVVVTHHAPSGLSCGHRAGIEDAAYASDLSDLIRARSPDLWIHGHIHRRCDYVIENTRVLANPRGYESEGWSENPEFDPQFVVEVGV